MLDAISAETLKLTRHKATWFLVWLYPVGFLLIFLISIGVGIAGIDPPDRQGLAEWLEETAVVWEVPGQALGRYMLAAFVAVVFAGEYGWNTWKLIVPHRARSALIAAKYAVAFALLAIAFSLAAAVSVAGSWADDVLTGDTTPAGITAGALLRVHGEGALAAVAPTLVTIGYTSLAALLTRSTMAALVVAIVAVTAEQIIFGFGPGLSLKAPGLISILYHGLPGYHLANLKSWIDEGVVLTTQFPLGPAVALPWATSLAAAAAWVGGLATLTFLSFGRQDLN